jgi:ribosome-binding factor A
MTVPGRRHERIGEEIQHELAAMVAGELKDPRLEVGVIVTEVRVTPDLKHVRASVAVYGEPSEQHAAIKALEHAAGYIRHELVERLRLRRAPEIHFFLDRSHQFTERVENLLREMKKKDDPSSS